MTTPVLKWVGGKSWMAADLTKTMMPHDRATDLMQHYVDPFCGGLGAFLAWRAMVPHGPAMLSDANAAVVECYRQIQVNPAAVAEALECLHDATPTDPDRWQERYYGRRADFNAALDPAGPDLAHAHVAALLIWLNKNGYNGLWRVNRRGLYNVPIGSGPGMLPSRAAIHALSDALRGVTISTIDYKAAIHYALAECMPGVLYLDPPYVTPPEQATKGHTSYAAGGFSAIDQATVAHLAVRAVNLGWRVVVSNHDTPQIRALYPETHFKVAARPIRRGSISQGARKAQAEILLVGARA